MTITALSPVPIFRAFDSANLPLAGGLLYTYATSTLTPLAIYSSSDTSTPNSNPVVLDSTGSATVRLDPNAAYKFVLKDSLGTTQWTEDYWQANYLTQADIGAILYPRTSAEIAAGVTPVAYSYTESHAFRYGADPTGATDSRAALQATISVAVNGGAAPQWPPGSYLIRRVAGADSQFNGLVIPYSGVFGFSGMSAIRGSGQSTVLKAGDNSMTVIRLSDSHWRLSNFSIDSNGKSGITGISLIGSNTASTTLAEHIDWNILEGISISECAEGFEFESPSLGGCYYNRIVNTRLYNNTRHVRFRDNATSKGANRNMLRSVQMNGGNTGVHIEGGDTISLVQCTFEDISVGASPTATPTAVRVVAVGALGGLANDNTNLISCIFENCTRDGEFNARRISIVGGNCGSVGAVAGSATPDFWIGGDAIFRLRELFIGDPAADGLSINDRITTLGTYANIFFGGSANAAGSFPFENDGTAIIKGRSSASSGIAFVTGATPALRGHIDGLGNTAVGQMAALATNATDGFAYVPSCAGTPTGTPTTKTGLAPIVVDSTDNRWYFYSGGAWRNAGP